MYFLRLMEKNTCKTHAVDFSFGDGYDGLKSKRKDRYVYKATDVKRLAVPDVS